MKKATVTRFAMPHPEAREPALRAVIQAAYDAFSPYHAPQELLDVCTACCMDEEVEHEMRRLPLRALTERHFYQYNDSAKSSVQPASEIKYFLPRLLELLADGARLHHSTELYLDRVGRCEPGSFSEGERKALQDYALGFFSLGLEQWAQASTGLFQGEDAFSILLMWDYAGVDLVPLLEAWTQCTSASSTLYYVDACYWQYLCNGNQIGNAFASDRPQYRATLERWLTAPASRINATARLMRLMDQGPVSDWLPAGACDNSRHPLGDRISAVFDAFAL